MPGAIVTPYGIGLREEYFATNDVQEELNNIFIAPRGGPPTCYMKAQVLVCGKVRTVPGTKERIFTKEDAAWKSVSLQ